MTQSDIFTVEGPQSIPEIERELREFNEEPRASLLLPTKIRQSLLGGQASLVQLIATWASRPAETKLVTHIQSGEPPELQLERLARKPFGFAALCMADEITDRSGGTDLKRSANRICAEQLRAMTFGAGRQHAGGKQSLLFEDDDASKFIVPKVQGEGAQVFLAAVDHRSGWQIPQCYFPDGTLRQRDDFKALGISVLERITQLTSGSQVSPDLFDPLGTIFHELFRNTHEHARTDLVGAPLRRSIRGIFAARYSWNMTDAEAAVQEAKPLKDFIAPHTALSSERYLKFIEISVFDSGIGLAARWMKDKWTHDIAPEQELWACQSCLGKWASSTDRLHKGLGLHEVFEMLSRLKAFLRLRTGNLSLYRDFSTHPVATSGSISDSQLFDWASGTTTPTRLAPVARALFTMLIPVQQR